MSSFGLDIRWRRCGGFVLAGTLLASVWASVGGDPSAAASKSVRAAPYIVQFDIELTGTGQSFPASPPATVAAFHGLPVKVITCDDQGTISGNIDCEHAAVTNHAAVVIEGSDNEDQTVLEQAGIPEIGVTNDTSSNSFDVSVSQSLFVGMAVALHKLGCQRLGILIDEGGESFAKQVADSFKWRSATEAFVPLTAPDLSPYVAKLADAHVQCVSMAAVSTQIPQILIALKQAKLKATVALPGVILTPQVLQQLGPLSNGLVEIESAADPGSSSAAIDAVARHMHAINRSLQVTVASLDAWAWSKLIQDAAATIHGTVDASSMMTALNHLRNAQTDRLDPPLSMIPLKNPNYRRAFDTYVISYAIKNGKPTDSSGFFNVAPKLNALPG